MWLCRNTTASGWSPRVICRQVPPPADRPADQRPEVLPKLWVRFTLRWPKGEISLWNHKQLKVFLFLPDISSEKNTNMNFSKLHLRKARPNTITITNFRHLTTRHHIFPWIFFHLSWSFHFCSGWKHLVSWHGIDPDNQIFEIPTYGIILYCLIRDNRFSCNDWCYWLSSGSSAVVFHFQQSSRAAESWISAVAPAETAMLLVNWLGRMDTWLGSTWHRSW